MTLPSIRRATSSDASALSVFAGSVFCLGCPRTAPADLAAYISAELSAARFLSLLEDPNIIVLLAESSRRIVAYMVVVLRSAHANLSAPVSAEFRKLYVDPVYHGTGLASALLHCALSIVQSDAPRPIWLSVFSENPRAISFYRKWGFEVVGTQEFIVGTDRQSDFLMQRPSAACASPTQ